MSRNRIFLIGGILIASAGVGWHYFPRSIAPNVDATYTAGNFTAAENGKTYAFDGVGNLLIGSFTLPNPVADSLIVDGASNAVAAKDILTAFPSNNKMYDTNNSDTFNNGEGIIVSADMVLGANDVVSLPGIGALQTIPTVNAPKALMYVDQGSTSSSFDPQEDILQQVFNNTGNVTADGSTLMRTAENTFTFFDVNLNGQMDFDANDNAYSLAGETLLRDADSDGRPSAGDSIITAQNIGLRRFSPGSGGCFDGSISNDPDYNAGEIVWLDVAGDCTSFTTGVDSILLGNAVPTGGSTAFGTAENEIGYLDVDNSGTFTCSRTSVCEPVVYSGVYGIDLFTGSYPPLTMAFFDSSTEGTDGIATTGTAWDESGGLENVIRVNALLNGSEQKYVYIDANSDSLYTVSEDIFSLVVSGSAASLTTLQTIRTFDANEKMTMNPGIPMTSFAPGNGAIVLSTDANLSAGPLDGSGTDRVLLPGTVLDGMPAPVKYFDHDLSGSFASGDDIVGDVDASGYFNADDILTTQVIAAASVNAISDSYLTGVSIYQRVGNTCVGAGTDTLVGSDVSTPFLGQAITITKAPYAATDAVASRTLCVYANIADNGVHGKIWQLVIPTGGTSFASGGGSPTSDFTVTSNPVQFTINAPVVMTATSVKAGQSSMYTFTYTATEDAIDNAQGLLDATFPATFSVTGATVACTDDGVSVSITPSISSQLVRAVNASGSAVASGSVVSCVVSGVINSTTTGTSGAFTIGADAGSTTLMKYVDTDNTITLSSASHSDSSSVATPNVITLSAPNGGESLTAGSTSAITWSTTGTGISYVNISYSLDSGSTWSSIATNEANDSSYSWTVPSVNSSSVMIKVQGTDLVTIVDDDTSDAVFSISSSSGSSTSTATTTTTTTDTGATTTTEVPATTETPITTSTEPESSTLTGGIYIKLADSPTVYAIDNDIVRHPFYDAQTFFTYQSNFDGVLTVDTDTFYQSILGNPMPVNSKTILVKFGTDTAVYSTNTDEDGAGLLVLIPYESTAVSAMGEKWYENVITLESDAFAYYRVSSESETPTSLAQWASSGYLTNKWHLMYADAINDPDGDGAATWIEAMWGTSPYDPDTDNDGYNDWLEVETGHSPFVSGGV